MKKQKGAAKPSDTKKGKPTVPKQLAPKKPKGDAAAYKPLGMMPNPPA